MLKRNLLLVVLVFVVFLGSCADWEANQVSDLQEQTMELVLRFEKSTYYVGEDIVTTITLKNTGKNPVLVNSRMSVNLPVLSSPIREITFRITMPNGEGYWSDAFIDPRQLRREDFIELKPKESYETTIHLSSYFTLTELGVYKVIANYQNFIDPSFVDLDDTRVAWKGELNSNEVFLTIIP